MKKILLLFTLLMLSITALLGCARGNVKNTERTIINCGAYSEKEINHAMDIVEKQFAKSFTGCTLLTLSYDSEDVEKEETEWCETYEAKAVIILESSFETDSRGGDGSLNPDAAYTGFQWILAKDKFGQWHLKDSGY